MYKLFRSDKIKVTLRQESNNKKIAKVKFSKEESAMIREVSCMTGRTIEELIGYALEAAVRDTKSR